MIGEYFVINDELYNLLKITEYSILHIDQLDNIITHSIVNKNLFL